MFGWFLFLGEGCFDDFYFSNCSGSGRTMCAPMGGRCIQCPSHMINQSVGRDALIPPRRNLTIYNKRCKLPVGDDALHRPARRVLPYLPPPKLANLFSLSSTRLIVNLNPPSPLTFHFSPRYTILQFAQTFWGKAVTACQSKHRSSARWTQRAGGISPGRNLPTSSASAGPPSGKPSLPCVRTAPPLKPLPTAAMLCPTGQTC